VEGKPVAAVDLIGPAIEAIAEATGLKPKGKPGLIRKTNEEYFGRIDAMEFAVDHDDGRNMDDLAGADIVLIGVSRTSKTPLSIYLASRGYRVANVPLSRGIPDPPQLFTIDSRRIFGLTSQAGLLSEIRYRRLGDAAAYAGSYAEIGNVQEDLDEARLLMRRLGCIVIKTDNRAIEETAQEILRYYELAYPSHKTTI
jgi:regulator of PEP synthase PpsR (kinase-PPPase family)